MPVNSTHPSYDENAEAWQRIRDVLAGDTAIKRAGEKYVPRLDSQTDDEFRAYVERGFFYNATARTVSGYIGMIFRRDPVLGIGMPATSPMRRTLEAFTRDVDLLGTSLNSYSKKLVHDVVALGRAGTLIDWGVSTPATMATGEPARAYVSMYAAESILNWQEMRIGGQMKLGLVVLVETARVSSEDDPFVVESVPQIRVLKLIQDFSTGGREGANGSAGGSPAGTGKSPVLPGWGGDLAGTGQSSSDIMSVMAGCGRYGTETSI